MSQHSVYIDWDVEEEKEEGCMCWNRIILSAKTFTAILILFDHLDLYRYTQVIPKVAEWKHICFFNASEENNEPYVLMIWDATDF